jgi:membrane protein DedA with SNARE-associated domain
VEDEILRILQQYPAASYLTVFGMLLACGLGLPLPEDITLLGAGYAVYLAQDSKLANPALFPMIAVGMVGVMAGDTILFLLGRRLGPKAIRAWPFRLLITAKRMERVQHFFSKYGVWTAFFARFAAGIRAPIYLLAGSSGMRFRTFFLADIAAAALSVPLLIWAAWHFGAEIDRVKYWLGQSRYAVGAVVLLAASWIIYRAIRARRAASTATEN